MPGREEIAQQALELPPEDRVYVADMLERSLAAGGFASEEIAAAWDAEIERRLEAYDRGEVEPIPADVAIERLRQHLAEHRARKATS